MNPETVTIVLLFLTPLVFALGVLAVEKPKKTTIVFLVWLVVLHYQTMVLAFFPPK